MLSSLWYEFLYMAPNVRTELNIIRFIKKRYQISNIKYQILEMYVKLPWLKFDGGLSYRGL